MKAGETWKLKRHQIVPVADSVDEMAKEENINEIKDLDSKIASVRAIIQSLGTMEDPELGIVEVVFYRVSYPVENKIGNEIHMRKQLFLEMWEKEY